MGITLPIGRKLLSATRAVDVGCNTEAVTQPQQGAQMAQFALAVDWAAAADVPTTHVNQFAAQAGPPNVDGTPDGVYLLFGSIAPPLIFGKDETTLMRELESLKSITVTVHDRFHMSRARLGELIDVLQQAAVNYDRGEQLARNTAPSKES
jgi:hypothetical protein